MDEIYKNIEEQHRKCVQSFDDTQQLLNAGDIVYTYIDGKCRQVVVNTVQHFGEGAYVFYWVHNPNIKWIDKLRQYTRFYWWLYIGRKFGQLQHIDPKFGFGHAVRLGRNNELFFTREQCELDFLFNCIKNDIQDIEYIVEQE